MISYFLWVNLYGLLFLGLYAVFLRNKGSHSWSRFYLLSAVLLSGILPFIKIELAIAGTKQLETISQLLPEVVLNGNVNTVSQTGMNWPLIVYPFVSISSLLLFCFRILKLTAFLKQHKLENESGYRIALNTGMGPASFGNIIIFPGTEIRPEMLQHELAHLNGRHHYDKLFINLILCFFFPVAAFYIIRKELETVHEFEADAIAAGNREQYAALLLNQHFHTRHFSLLQSFFHHPIKRRIKMLYNKQKPQGKKRGLLVLLSATLLIVGIVLQSQNNLMAQDKTKNNKTANSDAKQVTRENIKGTGSENIYYQEKQGEKWVMANQQNPEKEVFTAVEHMPEFPGGRDSLLSYLVTNLRYPGAARKANVQGKVVAQFVVNQVGKIEGVEIKRGLSPECDAETVRVIKAMPTWKPGEQDGKKVRVYFTLPVSFRLSN